MRVPEGRCNDVASYGANIAVPQQTMFVADALKRDEPRLLRGLDNSTRSLRWPAPQRRRPQSDDLSAADTNHART